MKRHDNKINIVFSNNHQIKTKKQEKQQQKNERLKPSKVLIL
jgi:hypothetical protein